MPVPAALDKAELASPAPVQLAVEPKSHMPLQFIQIHLEICQLNILITEIVQPLSFFIFASQILAVLERIIKLKL